MGGLGPMAGQNHHFSHYAPTKIRYAIDRYVKETNRLYGVLNKRLADRQFIAGEYSIADMATQSCSFARHCSCRYGWRLGSGIPRRRRPAHGDYAVFGAFQWARATSPFKLLEPDDPVASWREWMLDLYGGFARKSVGYPV